MNKGLTNMQEFIEQYLEDMKLAWSASTLRSETYRLKAVSSYLNGDAKTLWNELEGQGMAPYARVTTWTRVTAFWDWLLEGEKAHGPNPYRIFRKKFARQFRHTYTKRIPSISFDEAKRRIERIHDNDIRSKALELLSTGMRYTESFTIEAGHVTGKGGKRRAVYHSGSVPSTYSSSYSTFWRTLGRVGLKPHDLRKICMNKLVEQGANQFELCEIAGWSKIDTASSYIQGNKSSIKELMKKVNE